MYRKRAVPYLLALAQHTLIGDFLLGGPFQLLWPVSTQNYGIGMSITSQLGQALELAAFLVAIAMMIATRDLAAFMKPRKSNLILAVPAFTVILPTFISYPMQVPTLLIAPHVIYLAMFTASILAVILKAVKRNRAKPAMHPP